MSYLAAFMALLSMVGCSTAGTLQVSGVSYQSINTKVPQPQKSEAIPESAKIVTMYAIDENGKLAVFVKNLTDEIMIVDQEMSFFIDPSGNSISYFDPTVRTSTTTNFSSGTTGASLNLGAVASAFGIGGPLGALMGGVNVGGSSTSGGSQANTVIIADQKRINIGPRGGAALSKTYSIPGVGKNSVSPTAFSTSMTYKESPTRFSVCVSYSLDGGESFEKLVTDFYVSSNIYVPVSAQGKENEAMRMLLSSKSDMLSQPWYLIHLCNNIKTDIQSYDDIPFLFNQDNVYDNIVQGGIWDYQ